MFGIDSPGMAAEFRGHVDEMVRQSELDEVKKQLEGPSGLDLKSLDPTREIKSAIQEGMAEGEKAVAEAKGTFDNPLAEPESAPQIAVEPAAEPTPEVAPTIAVEPPPEPAPATAEATPPSPAESSPPAEQEKPAKAVAAG